ncbi:glycosyl transferase family 2 [Bacteroides clarus]|uniref:Glycosyl transferase family 2 n=1 Tax=Bacteroides clarus TaxID=626929 RepID=A0A1Y4JK49_9BACE|nr:glycosyltransferase [Bacteroides clarus]OUP32894.1 glycosyl transferase family 2 [Bacteroides clarus]
MPEVSVIIPIYNTAAYLRKALDSICDQTLKELEIILIDDGSTDGSRGIIEEYAERDARIRWYAQPNQGQGVARNTALALATGRYIYFMDSDDLLGRDALRHCHEECERHKLDFAFFDAETILEDRHTPNLYDYRRKGIVDENKLWNGIELLDFEINHRKLLISPCLFFTRRSFLERCFKGFPSGIIHEDHVFAMDVLLNARRARYIAQPYFKRRVRGSSTMTGRFGMRNIEGYTAVCTRMRALGEERPEWKAVIGKYLSYTLNDVIWAGHRMSLLEKVETACRFRRLRLGKYVSFRNWAVFWLKKK